MTSQAPRPRRFLGRPDAAYPGFVPDGTRTPAPAHTDTRSRAGLLWLIQALSGALLLVFLTVHLVAQHLLVPGGLRDYASVVSYLHEPVALIAEMGLFASVIVHAVLGLRSTLVEVVGVKALRRIWIGLLAGGAIAFGYSAWLTMEIVLG